MLVWARAQHILFGRRIQPHWLVDTSFSSFKILLGYGKWLDTVWASARAPSRSVCFGTQAFVDEMTTMTAAARKRMRRTVPTNRHNKHRHTHPSTMYREANGCLGTDANFHICLNWTELLGYGFHAANMQHLVVLKMWSTISQCRLKWSDRRWLDFERVLSVIFTVLWAQWSVISTHPCGMRRFPVPFGKCWGNLLCVFSWLLWRSLSGIKIFIVNGSSYCSNSFECFRKWATAIQHILEKSLPLEYPKGELKIVASAQHKIHCYLEPLKNFQFFVTFVRANSNCFYF